MSEFYNKFIKTKYKNHLIILDNAKFHKSKDVIDNIEKSENKIIYSLPYNPSLNPIENLFSQFKNHIKRYVYNQHLLNVFIISIFNFYYLLL